jgi:hypothetical protein
MLKHDLRCEICHSKFDSHYNIPKVLSCGHTICSRCLDRMRDKNINRCPFDRKLIDFDEDKVPNNFYILSLIDGSVKGNVGSYETEKEEEEELELCPKTVVNNPGWKNTLAGFIKGEVLYTAESNGFIYCTDLNTGEWWFLYLSQFWGTHMFLNPCTNKMYLIDHNGSLFQLFNKNYYTQIGKKNSWKNTSHLCVFEEKLYSVETSDKLYETTLESGKWKEIGAKKFEDEIAYDENIDSHSDPNSDNGENEDGDNTGDSSNNLTRNNNIINDGRNLNMLNSSRENLEGILFNLNNVNSIAGSENFNIPSDNPLFQFNIAGFNLRIPNFFNGLTNFSNNRLASHNSTEEVTRNMMNNDNQNFKLNTGNLSTKHKDQCYFNVKDTVMLVSTKKNMLIANKSGELLKLDKVTGHSKVLKTDFNGNISSYSNNLTHVYFIEKNSRIVYRLFIKDDDININDDLPEICETESKVSELERKLTNLNMNINIVSSNKTNSYTPNDTLKAMNNKNLSDNSINNSYGNSSNNNMIIENVSIASNEIKQNKDKPTENFPSSNSHEAKTNSNSTSNNNIKNNFRLSGENKNTSSTNESNENTASNVDFSFKNSSSKADYLKVEKFIELDEQTSPTKVIANEKKLVVIDKKGDLWVYDIETKDKKNFQCLFMLRNCHMQNSILMGDGDLVILDPIRLSLNKLNIITGTEVIMLHSLKFLSTIKHIFSSGTKLYFIDVSGNLYNFLESEKKIAQIGSSGICRYLIDGAIYKNFLYSIENNILYKTNLNDGSFVEVKNDYTHDYKYFFSDYVQLLFISKGDFIYLVIPGENLKLKKKFYYPNISKIQPLTYFKNHIIFYNQENRSIDGINLEKYEMVEDIKQQNEKNEKIKFEINSKMINDSEGVTHKPKLKAKVMIENFPEVLMFLNNNECLACILKDGLIYKLYC